MHNTNLASEFYILSILHRLGHNAFLTLGNKKAVDILVEINGKVITIDVKGIKDKGSFPVDNLDLKLKNHLVVFVSYLNQIGNPNILPETHIVPVHQLTNSKKVLNGDSIIYTSPKSSLRVQLGRLRKVAIFQNAWHLIK